MQLETFRYDQGKGLWSVEKLPSLDSERTIVLAFGAAELQSRQELFQTLRHGFPKSHLIGCSTAGEILNGKVYDGTLSVAVMKFAKTDLVSTSAVVRNAAASDNAAVELARGLTANQHGQRLSGVLVFADGVSVDHRALLARLISELGNRVPIVGAFAADGHRFERPWVLYADRLQSGLCAALGLYGDAVVLRSAASEEWGPGTPGDYVVTSAENNVMYTLNGMPALDVCRGNNGALRPIKLVEGNTLRLLTPLSVNEAARAVIVNRQVAQGSRIQVLEADTQSMIRGAAAAASAVQPTAVALEQVGATTLALALSSYGRRTLLGNRATDEITSMVSCLPAPTRVLGLYSYGGIAQGADATPFVHDAAIGVAILSEVPSQDDRDNRASTPEGTLGYEAGSPFRGGSGAGEASQSQSGSLKDVRPQTQMLGSITATIYRLGALRFIALSGSMNESFDSTAASQLLRGRVILDLAGIEQITSFGVRAWLEMMSAAEPHLKSLFLANCSEAIVNQMLMVRNFAGPGHIVSFLAPYICTVCSNSFEFLLDCEHSAREIKDAAPPDVACPNCGNRALFDDDPTTYFQFVERDVGVSLPDDARAALAERRLEWLTTVEDSIEKQVEGSRSVFRINRNIDEGIRWQRVLQGVEGNVRLDFTLAKGATPTGAERLLAALRVAADAVDEIVFDQVPLEVVMRMIESEPIAKLRVRTLSVPARCANCGVVRQASIDPVAVRDARRQGLQPESQCRRCSGSIPITLPSAVVAYLEGSKVKAGAAGDAGGGATTFSSRTLMLIGGALLATLAIIIVINFLL